MIKKPTNDDLSFYTSDELIWELINRQTFVGIIVKADKDMKVVDSKVVNMPTQFEIHVQNISPEDAAKMFEDIAGHIRSQ